MQIVFDYLSGELSADDFKEAWYENPQIALWLDSLIDLTSSPEKWKQLPFNEYRMAIFKHFDGSLAKFIHHNENLRESSAHPKSIGWYFNAIASVVVVAYPDAKITSYYNDEIDFEYAVRGDIFGGDEVEDCIESILVQYPGTLGKTKRKKEAKAALRSAFHIEGSKYPRWIQEPEWPMGTQSPMAFVKQCRDGDLVTFTFRDVDTGDTRVVEQFY